MDAFDTDPQYRPNWRSARRKRAFFLGIDANFRFLFHHLAAQLVKDEFIDSWALVLCHSQELGLPDVAVASSRRLDTLQLTGLRWLVIVFAPPCYRGLLAFDSLLVDVATRPSPSFADRNSSP